MVNPAKNNRTANVKGKENYSKTVCQGNIKLLLSRHLYGIWASLASHTSAEGPHSGGNSGGIFSPQSRGEQGDDAEAYPFSSIQHSPVPCSSVQHSLPFHPREPAGHRKIVHHLHHLLHLVELFHECIHFGHILATAFRDPLPA